MKPFVLILLLIIIVYCSKEKQQVIEKDIELNITKSEWYTSISDTGFCKVYLIIEGNTNGELVTIETGGDGLAGCKEVTLDQNKNFSEELMIYFYPNCDSIPKKFGTYVNSYEKLESPEIIFCRTGTGKTIRKFVESDYLSFEKKRK